MIAEPGGATTGLREGSGAAGSDCSAPHSWGVLLLRRNWGWGRLPDSGGNRGNSHSPCDTFLYTEGPAWNTGQATFRSTWRVPGWAVAASVPGGLLGNCADPGDRRHRSGNILRRAIRIGVPRASSAFSLSGGILSGDESGCLTVSLAADDQPLLLHPDTLAYIRFPQPSPYPQPFFVCVA